MSSTIFSSNTTATTTSPPSPKLDLTEYKIDYEQFQCAHKHKKQSVEESCLQIVRKVQTSTLCANPCVESRLIHLGFVKASHDTEMVSAFKNLYGYSAFIRFGTNKMLKEFLAILAVPATAKFVSMKKDKQAACIKKFDRLMKEVSQIPCQNQSLSAKTIHAGVLKSLICPELVTAMRLLFIKSKFLRFLAPQSILLYKHILKRV